MGVKRVRSDLRSSSGVPYKQQSSPRTITVPRPIPTSRAIAVPIGFGRAGDLSEKLPREVRSLPWVLQHEIAPRKVQPIEHLDPLVLF